MKKIVFNLVMFLTTLIFIQNINAKETTTADFNGFVDASVNYNRDSDISSFNLDQVELDISKTVNKKTYLRADIQYVNGADNTTDDILEQGFIRVTAPLGEGLDFTFGKFNAPIGFELLEPVDMYQYSHALVFDYGLPTNLTGLMVSTSMAQIFDFNIYVVNGWDNISDNNKDKSFGTRIGITPFEGINFGISGITGAEQDNNGGNKREVIDIDGTITAINDLTLGLEFNWGWEEGASQITGTSDARWFGLLLMIHYDYANWGGITFRYDYFDDKDNARIGNGGFEQQAITFAPTFVIGEGLGAIIEFRHDFSNDKQFTADNETVAFEMTYSF